MKKALAVLVFGVLFTATPARASYFALESFTVTLHEVDPGLKVWATPEVGTLPGFELANVGDSITAGLFTIGTNEDALNLDDLVPYSISVAFDFLLPSPGFGGLSAGLTGAAWLGNTFGYVAWDNPLVLNFGTTGQLGINLSPEKFGLPGSAPVEATFTLLRRDSPVAAPEPLSGALLGLGALAVMVARRRSTSIA